MFFLIIKKCKLMMNSLSKERLLKIEMKKDGQVKYLMDQKCKFTIEKLYHKKMQVKKVFGVMTKK
jgi:hypothetical protein